MKSTASTSHLLPIHRGVMAAVGPEGLDEIAGPPSPHEADLIDAYLRRIGIPDLDDVDDVQLAARLGIRPGLAGDVRDALGEATR